MKNFYDKIQEIQKLLPTKGIRRSKLLLATAIYFKVRTNTSFRKVPLVGVPFSWYNLRYWFQKLEHENKLERIQNIVGVGGGASDESFTVE